MSSSYSLTQDGVGAISTGRERQPGTGPRALHLGIRAFTARSCLRRGEFFSLVAPLGVIAAAIPAAVGGLARAEESTSLGVVLAGAVLVDEPGRRLRIQSSRPAGVRTR